MPFIGTNSPFPLPEKVTGTFSMKKVRRHTHDMDRKGPQDSDLRDVRQRALARLPVVAGPRCLAQCGRLRPVLARRDPCFLVRGYPAPIPRNRGARRDLTARFERGGAG